MHYSRGDSTTRTFYNENRSSAQNAALFFLSAVDRDKARQSDSLRVTDPFNLDHGAGRYTYTNTFA